MRAICGVNGMAYGVSSARSYHASAMCVWAQGAVRCGAGGGAARCVRGAARA